MQEYILKAARYFIEHQIREEYKESDSFTSTNNISTFINIIVDTIPKKVTIVYSKDLLQKIATIYLMEENCDDHTLAEMALETTNMIVGSAKTIASESNTPFTIETPFLQDISITNGSVLEVDSKQLLISLEN